MLLGVLLFVGGPKRLLVQQKAAELWYVAADGPIAKYNRAKWEPIMGGMPAEAQLEPAFSHVIVLWLILPFTVLLSHTVFVLTWLWWRFHVYGPDHLWRSWGWLAVWYLGLFVARDLWLWGRLCVPL